MADQPSVAPATGSGGDQRRRETLTARTFVRKLVRTEGFGLCNTEQNPRRSLRLAHSNENRPFPSEQNTCARYHS
jgi:hypothetical protein